VIILDTSECRAKVVDLLIAERERAGLKQGELAKRLKLQQSFVSRLESGQRRIEVCEFFIFAQAIGFDPHAALRRIMPGGDNLGSRGGQRGRRRRRAKAPL
jgi:transcriptional regulator with XRE-family HTH domain